MFETEIIRIPILPFGRVNAHLVRNTAACILIDAGVPGSEHRIARSLTRHGLSFRDIKLIILTHAHADNAGNAARLRDLSGAPILAHEGDADLYRQQGATAYCPTRGPGRFLRAPEALYRGFEPDIAMKAGERINLLDFAIDGIVHHIGGHTPGSIAIELASHDVLAGDFTAPRAGRAGHDPKRIAREVEQLVRAGVRRFHLGRGRPLSAGEILRHAGVARC